MKYFPMVGLFLGFILAFFNTLLNYILPGPVVDGILLIILIILTGALHLDGLVDTVDGLAGGNTKDEILRIMRDSSTGAIGAVGLTALLLLKYVSLMHIPDDIKNQVLVAMPVISRYSMVQVSFFSEYARAGSGIGSPFTSHVGKAEFLMASTITLLLSAVLLGVKGIVLIVMIGICTWGLIALYKKKIGGTTGDSFGATNEVNEVLVLIFLLALIHNIQ
jgi:adenosylcobinamide-GDP ribazoletransferase